MLSSSRVCAVSAAVLVLTAAAPATVINLSTHSSDETDPALLDAMFDFETVDSQLTLTVTNATAEPNGYRLNKLYFNVDPDSGVTGLQLVSGPAFWTLATDQSVAAFGVFDFGLIDEGNSSLILPGATETFVFTILGMGFKADFADAATDRGFLIAAKFVSGPDDDSAFGATLPGPGTLAAVLAGLLGLSRRRR